MSLLRVVIADDQDLVRAGFSAIVEAESDLTVVGTAGRGDDAVKLVRRLRPDVVLMDIRMPGITGIEALRQIRSDPDLASVRVLVLTTFGLDEYVFEALRAGARGFLVKDTPPERLIEAIRLVAADAVVLGDGLVDRLVTEFVRVSPTPMPKPELTSREQDVLLLLCDGLTNRQIASRLGIGEATVKTYVSRLLAAFGVESRVMLAATAIRSAAIPVQQVDPDRRRG